MQKIISWNVASVRARQEALTELIRLENPDVLLLQEIKATEDNFPFFDFQIAGYTSVISGQKGYNGVAVLARQKMDDILYELPGLQDEDKIHARFIQAKIDGIVFISVYAPNGNPPEKNPNDMSRLHYKIRWFQALIRHVAGLIEQGEKIILGGDFNVIERDTDVYNPELFRNSALMAPDVRQQYQALLKLPMTNVIRQFNPNPHTYSFWDFQQGGWPKNKGILLDAFLVSDSVCESVQNGIVYKDVRAWLKTSDHVPVGITISASKTG